MDEKKNITGEMTIAEIMVLYPTSGEVFTDWGLSCAMCHIGAVETLEEGAAAHGFSTEEIETLLEELNEAAKES